jgi:hypothetical protein
MIYIKRIIAIVLATLITMASFIIVLANNCYFVVTGKALELVINMNNDIILLFNELREWANKE